MLEISSASSSSTWDEHPAPKRAQQAPDLDHLLQQLQGLSLDLDYWQMNASRVRSGDPQQQLVGAHQFRIILSLSGEIPIQSVIDAGVVPLLASLLGDAQNAELQFEAAWALTNIASGTSDQTRAVVEAGSVPLLAALLCHAREDIREQGMWGLGNIAGDQPEFRDLILATVPGIIQKFVKSCLRSCKPATIRTGVWALSNFCRGKPRANVHALADAVPYLISVISTSADADCLADACWALDGLTECPTGTRIVAASGAVPYLIRHLAHPSIAVQRPALRVTGQIVTGDSSDTELVVQHGGLQAFAALLRSPRRCLRKDTCWALSNLAAGTSCQLQALLESGVVPDLLRLLEQDPELEVRREAAWTICNVCTTHVERQVEYLMSVGCLAGVVKCLLIADEKMMDVALEALGNFIRFWGGRQEAAGDGSDDRSVLAALREHGLVANLGALHQQAHQVGCYDLWKKIGRILQQFEQAETGGTAAPCSMD